jgi:tRNA threonylcarbamoyladenosine biosynthesis protein TsaB
VAVATAKTLAFALQKPLVGVSTLEIAAAQFSSWSGPICSLLEAGRGELYAACYQFQGGRRGADLLELGPRQLGDYRVIAPAELLPYLQEEIAPALSPVNQGESPIYLCCGEISEASRQVLADQIHFVFAPALLTTRHASTLARLAYQRFVENRLDDSLLLEPLYLRRPSITTSARKQPLLGKKSSQSDPPTDHDSTEREQGALRH